MAANGRHWRTLRRSQTLAEFYAVSTDKPRLRTPRVPVPTDVVDPAASQPSEEQDLRDGSSSADEPSVNELTGTHRPVTKLESAKTTGRATEVTSTCPRSDTSAYNGDVISPHCRSICHCDSCLTLQRRPFQFSTQTYTSDILLRRPAPHGKRPQQPTVMQFNPPPSVDRNVVHRPQRKQSLVVHGRTAMSGFLTGDSPDNISTRSTVDLRSSRQNKDLTGYLHVRALAGQGHHAGPAAYRRKSRHRYTSKTGNSVAGDKELCNDAIR